MRATELVGVYDADGGLLGEAAYAWGRLRGTRHCSLCEITHSMVRRRPAWDRMVAGLPVPVRLLHLNELDDELATAVSALGAPVVLARTAGAWDAIVSPAELEAAHGSIERLGALLQERLDERAGETTGPGSGHR